GGWARSRSCARFRRRSSGGWGRAARRSPSRAGTSRSGRSSTARTRRSSGPARAMRTARSTSSSTMRNSSPRRRCASGASGSASNSEAKVMTKVIRPCAGAILATVIALVLTGCDLQVVNPGVIDAGTFDPTTDARTLSLSAQTNFYAAYANVVNFTGYFSGEAWVGATRQETNDFGRRVITPANLDINPYVWAPLSLAIASNEDVLDILDRAGVGAGDINAARSALYSGVALVLLGESFCEGVMRVGPAVA